MTLARSFALCLSFLLASTAAAQLVGPEVLSSPFTPQSPASLDDAPAASIARIGQSGVVAWPIVVPTVGTFGIGTASVGGS